MEFLLYSICQEGVKKKKIRIWFHCQENFKKKLDCRERKKKKRGGGEEKKEKIADKKTRVKSEKVRERSAFLMYMYDNVCIYKARTAPPIIAIHMTRSSAHQDWRNAVLGSVFTHNYGLGGVALEADLNLATTKKGPGSASIGRISRESPNFARGLLQRRQGASMKEAERGPS